MNQAVADRFGCPRCLSVFRSGFPRCPLDGSVLQTLSDDPLIGSVLAERYFIETLIGEGGMGRVYRARHMRMSRRFAIKVLFGDLAAESKARSRFSREAESSSRLSHPNVVSVVDFGETEAGLLYLVMDHIEGQELHRIVSRQAPFSTTRTLNLLRQLARGLAHAHDRGLVHRDFKTENILITVDGEDEIARIVDFGIAVLGEMTAPEQRLTTEGMVLGTPAYMSPEQSTGEEIDHRADLFSLGVMLYEMLSGKLPFDGSPIAMAKANLAARVPPVAERVPGLRADHRLEAVAMRLMAKEPGERFPSATALLAHLDQVFGRAADTEPPPPAAQETEAAAARSMSEEFLAAEVVDAVPSHPTMESVEIRRTERRRWMIAGGVALAALLVAGSALFAHYRSSRPDRTVVAAATATADAGQAEVAPPIPVAAPDAGAAAPAPADAAPVAAGQPTPAAAGKKPPPGHRKKEPAAGKSAPPPAAPVVSQPDFHRRYRQVGALLDKLTTQRGESAAEELSKKYFAIPYADALRSDSVRRDADRALRSLAARIDAELKK